jgi:hypothetical protein
MDREERLAGLANQDKIGFWTVNGKQTNSKITIACPFYFLFLIYTIIQ